MSKQLEMMTELQSNMYKLHRNDIKAVNDTTTPENDAKTAEYDAPTPENDNSKAEHDATTTKNDSTTA